MLYGLPIYIGAFESSELGSDRWFVKTTDGEGVVSRNGRLQVAVKKPYSDQPGALNYFQLGTYSDGLYRLEGGVKIPCPFKGAVTEYDGSLFRVTYKRRDKEVL